MPLYTLSSTEPEHYNRIRVSLPMEMSAKFINICVSSLTANANFRVLNNNDFITFNINNTVHKLKLKDYSKLTSASLPYVFQELLDEQSIPITVSMSDIDTIIFSCSEPFQITEMSYNAKLITGFYSTKADKFPLVSQPYETTAEIKTTSDPVDITQATVNNILVRKGYTAELKINLSPPTASGYSVEYEVLDDSIVQINYSDQTSCEVEGLKVGTTNIRIKIKNQNTSKTSDPDFVLTSHTHTPSGWRPWCNRLGLLVRFACEEERKKLLESWITFIMINLVGLVWFKSKRAKEQRARGSVYILSEGLRHFSHITIFCCS